MKIFNKFSSLLCLAIVAVLLGSKSLNAAPEDLPDEQGSQNRHSSFSNPLRLILNPIKSLFRYSRKMIESPSASVRENLDSVRLQTYQMFMKLYNKTYSPEEIPRRMALFFERRELIDESVRMFNQGKSLFSMRENDFIDWDDDELKKLTGTSLPAPEQMTDEEREKFQEKLNEVAEMGGSEPNGLSRNASARFKRSVYDDDDSMLVKANIPASKDWRDSGCIATPMNQEKCGACYAISTMSVVESMRCINQVSSPQLSPQQIVDCSTPRAGYQNFGCDGGWPTRALKYLQDVGVAARESCYPFVRRQNQCKLRQVGSNNGCTVSSSPTNKRLNYKVLNNERDILYHVANTGPVVTVMKASDKFLYYGNGIFDDRSCSRRANDVDHAIVIVGYGKDNGVDYWLIKNSWGTTNWGINGYGKYKRGTNACSIGHWGWVVTQ